MSRPEYIVQNTYTGTGNLASYAFDFKITKPEQLLIKVLDLAGDELIRVRGDDQTTLESITYDEQYGGGTVFFLSVLPSGWKLFLLLDDDQPIQDYSFRNKTSFTLRRFEDALDNIMGAIQTLMRRSRFALRMSDTDTAPFDPELPPGASYQGGRLLKVNDTGTAFEYGPKVEDIGGGSLPGPDDAIEGDYYEYDGTEVIWQSGVFEGFSARFNRAVEAVNIRDAINQIFDFQYVAPLISFSVSGSGTLREKGTTVSSTTLTADTTKKSDPITQVRFYRNNVLISTDNAPDPDGLLNSSFTDVTPYSDSVTYKADVSDGSTTVTSGLITPPYVYPYYWGASTPGKTAAQVALLGGAKQIQSVGNKNVTFTVAVGDIVYFAYPASYGALASIKDQNNFDALSGFTMTTENIVGLDGTTQSYRLYKLNNTIGVAGNTTYTFNK